MERAVVTEIPGPCVQCCTCGCLLAPEALPAGRPPPPDVASAAFRGGAACRAAATARAANSAPGCRSLNTAWNTSSSSAASLLKGACTQNRVLMRNIHGSPVPDTLLQQRRLALQGPLQHTADDR